MGRILIVDDEPNMRRILASNLRLDHHQIWEAGGVEEAQRTGLFCGWSSRCGGGGAAWEKESRPGEKSGLGC